MEVPAQGAGVTGAVEAPAQKCWEAQELTRDGGPRPFTCPFLSTPPGRLYKKTKVSTVSCMVVTGAVSGIIFILENVRAFRSKCLCFPWHLAIVTLEEKVVQLVSSRL